MKTFALTFALLLAACSPDVTQREHPTPPPTDASQADALPSQDRDFLEKAARGSNAEVAIGGITATRALRPEVLAFGQMMVRDHSAANAKLAAIATAKKIAMPTDLGEHQAGYDRVIGKQLDPFDREFARVMIDDHNEAVDLFRAEAANGADAELKAFAAAALPTIEAHLEQAKALLGKLAEPQ
jgi:putative membrane protein